MRDTLRSNGSAHLIRARLGALRSLLRRHPTAVSVAGCLIVAGALAIALAGSKDEFVSALGSAPFWVLGIAVALHIVWLVARSEAWSVCIRAAGGSVSRRRLYRASSIGYLGNIFNGQFGLAVRIAALRRSAPADSPRAPVLVAAELPIVVIEAALAAICSFTLVGPLGVPWWVPLICFGAMAAVIGGMQRVARNRREGFWNGLAVLRGLRGRSRIIALVIVAVVIQIARNWLLLNWSGVDASVFDSTALLIGLAVVGLLPVGPSLGAAAAVLILGTNGVAASAAAGTLLTVTAAVGALCFATWALADLLWRRRPAPAAATA
ncbi:MAG TPA: lysylphosphatidylglycerol synthase domain-containing protein [Solirubrobacterales bacterium]|jgi:uncharacterized membrane protein YbhN (UPF0104 family)|nr:lysylphosphatidylglycerol synthase domain-containing protein [Solirubrobacterales bacterium]